MARVKTGIVMMWWCYRNSSI